MSISDEFLARVKDAIPGVTVFDAQVPTNPDGTPAADRYVVVYPDLGDLHAEAVTGAPEFITFRFKVVYVTRGRQADRWTVEWLAGKVRDHVLGAQLDVEGWSLGSVEPDGAWPVEKDEDDPSALVLFARDGFAVRGSRI